MKKIAAATILATAVIGTAACGSDSGSGSAALTKDEYIAAADKICTTANEKSAEIPNLTFDDETSFEEWRDANVAVYRGATEQLRALTPPAADAAAFDTFYDDTDAFFDKFVDVSFADFLAGALDNEPTPTPPYEFDVCFT